MKGKRGSTEGAKGWQKGAHGGAGTEPSKSAINGSLPSVSAPIALGVFVIVISFRSNVC